MIKTLVSRVKGYEKYSIAAPFLAMLEAVLELMIPFLIAYLIDLGISKGDMGAIYFYGGLMLAAAALSLLVGILAGRFAARASTGFAANLRGDMYKNIQSFSFSNIDKYSTPGLVTRLTTDVMNVQNAFQMMLVLCVRAPVMLICAMVMAFSISSKLSMIFVVAMAILAVCLAIIMFKAMGIFEKIFKKYDELNAGVQENVSAIRVVKSYVREAFESEKFRNSAENVYKLFVKAEKILSFNWPAMMLAVYGSMVALSWFGAGLIIGGELTTGQLTSLFSYVMSILMSLMMLSMVFVMISMSLASMRRITEILNEEANIKSPKEAVENVAMGSIDFENVSFTYQKGSGDPVLQNISLHIDSGETIGIIGGTGSSKSSLVSLISRLYDTTQGTVKVGGLDVKKYNLDTLRNEVAVVLQKNVLFSGTVLENLRWGKENATLEECRAACKLACADEFIEKLENGYNSHVERGGANFSGGQKQRLCIARALLKNPKILILDDSTSAVDTATDGKIRKAFKAELGSSTKLIIAQRISSVQDADRIIVLDEGKISGVGCHDDLLKTNEIYRQVYEVQMSTGGDFDEKGD